MIALTILVSLVISIIILYLLSNYLNNLTAAYLPPSLYLFLMWPGVMIHELSHFLGCLITFTRVKQVELFKPQRQGGKIILGQVSHENTKNPIKKIIISLAPFFGVSATIWFFVWLLLPAGHLLGPINLIQASSSGFSSFGQSILGFLNQYRNYFLSLVASLDFKDWRIYLFIYLMLSLGSQAAPSRTDLKHTFNGLVVLSVVVLLVYLLISYLKINFVPGLAAYLVQPFYLLNFLLAYGIFFALIMLILTWGLIGLVKLIKLI